jgi:hypothetical protein
LTRPTIERQLQDNKHKICQELQQENCSGELCGDKNCDKVAGENVPKDLKTVLMMKASDDSQGKEIDSKITGKGQ